MNNELTTSLPSLAKTLGATYVQVIPTADISYTDAFVSACEQNRCGCYDSNWSCPPGIQSGQMRALILRYNSCLVFQICGTMDDPFDYEGIKKAQEAFSALCRNLRYSLKGRDVVVLGTGPCTHCSQCAYPEPCPFPEQRELNLEAAGIDVTALCKAANLAYSMPSGICFTGAVFFSSLTP